MGELKGYTCIECQETYFTRRPKWNHLCPNCGVKRAIEAARQMSAKEGPYYEKWKASQERALERQRVSLAAYHREKQLDKEGEESGATSTEETLRPEG